MQKTGLKEFNLFKMSKIKNTSLPEIAPQLSLLKEEPIRSKEENNLFPIFLKLENLSILIVGGGYVGLEKLTAILQNSERANIRLIAIKISDEIKQISLRYANLHLVEKPYNIGDLVSVDLVFAAVNDLLLSETIHNDAHTKGILINAADNPSLCDFYLSSIVQKGSLKIAISTNGKSPTIAKRLKEILADTIPDEMENVLDNIQDIRRSLHMDFTEKVKTLNKLTEGLISNGYLLKDTEKPDQKHWKKIAKYSLFAFAFMIIGNIIFSYISFPEIWHVTGSYYGLLEHNFHWMVLAGFLAQLVDGSLGMGYGVTSASILLSTGISPATISGSIHTAEMFASGASGYSHYKFGNVNKKLFRILVIPGVIGAVVGAFLLVFLGNQFAYYMKPLMAVYTLFLGVKILINAFKKQTPQKKFRRYGVLAGLGGFLDSFGGGGWGPIVTTTLITKGRTPRFVIGTVSLTEFFVTLASAFSFFILLGVSHVQTIIALIIGGFMAAPIAAKLTGRLPLKTSFCLLGILVIFWSLKVLINLL